MVFAASLCCVDRYILVDIIFPMHKKYQESLLQKYF
jgi:hypothetical protein